MKKQQSPNKPGRIRETKEQLRTQLTCAKVWGEGVAKRRDELNTEVASLELRLAELREKSFATALENERLKAEHGRQLDRLREGVATCVRNLSNGPEGSSTTALMTIALLTQVFTATIYEPAKAEGSTNG